ncbi:MAG: radical SAM protein [Planctomycetota bacterium]|jgi:radical SAM protein with 4Fe4S-binding SPASM domain
MKYRFESFGGIIAAQTPPFLAFVDRNYMRELGLGQSELWETDDETIGFLSAPTEVHFAITNRCSARCPHCYMAAGQCETGELDTESIKRVLDILARMNVFHVALGGGEALERPDLFEIAEYARRRDLVPNLTVSGLGINADIAQEMKVFGQVNVSVDGVGQAYGAFRGRDMFDVADHALDLLVAAKVPAGINCVLGRSNFDATGELFEYAAKKKLNEIEFLRLKPSGRGAALYEKEHTTCEQNTSLTPMLADLSARFGIVAKIDCSFVPMLCYHRPPIEILESTATYGCEAGNVLLGIRSNGSVSGCSFLKDSPLTVFDLGCVSSWQQSFESLRTWPERAREPCRSCEYLRVCKGGCRAVAEYVTGDFDAPDPDCPFVVDYQKERLR